MLVVVTAYRRVWRKGGPYRTSLTIQFFGKPWEVVWLIEPRRQ